MYKLVTRAGLAAVSASLVLAAAGDAHASGFAVARFGGPHGNPTEVNPSALYFNPAGLALSNGTNVLIDINWAQRSASYTRGENAVGLPADDPSDFTAAELAASSGEATLNNFVYAPALLLSSDFGLDLPFAVGAGFFVPFGGSAVWDTADVPDDIDAAYPGAVDGPQRWYTIDGTQRTLAFALGAAYAIDLPASQLSIGLVGNLYMSDVDTIRARNAAGTDALDTEGRSWLYADSTDIGLGAGLMYHVPELRLWAGLSYQSRPNFNGDMELEGTLENIFPPNIDRNDVTVTQRLPDILRGGVRWRPIERAEVRAFFDYTRWSALEQQCVIQTSALNGADPHEYCAWDPETGETANSVGIILNLGRDWHDAAGVRVGGSYWLANNDVELMLDLGFDGNAVPDETLEPALYDMNKVSVGAGAEIRLLGDGPVDEEQGFSMVLALSGTNIFYFERDTNGAETANTLRPTASAQPSSEGVYTQNIFVLNTGLGLSF